MAWNDYDRTDFGGYGGYRSRGRGPGSWEGTRYGAGSGRSRYGSDFAGTRYGGDFRTTGGYGYDYEVRLPPEQSPLYGRSADREVQRWARRYGYDVEYEIDPRGGQGGRPQRPGGGYASRPQGGREQGGAGSGWRGEEGGRGGFGPRRSGSRYGNTGWGGGRDSGDWW
jgi:hypothetical protein